ncbi:hypothetical protein CJ030_MR1G002476 [Morella rubra]|uniref:Bifunctional inhibitor/plant lipid transfer protein/seed storage helical domain-containing protein n=1 Tax=Morella rubra TaxID=262757 RepID=A0A6A1WNZ4_9ROSI|nr:hypothetical protein CJ030_MR1G002476 [Morella rubra]
MLNALLHPINLIEIKGHNAVEYNYTKGFRVRDMAVSSPKIFYLALALTMAFAGTLVSGERRTLAQSCGDTDVAGLVSQCETYVSKSGPKVKPSKECCAVVNAVNVPCVCKLVSKQIEGLINMEKVVFVARSCGKEVAKAQNVEVSFLLFFFLFLPSKLSRSRRN